MELVARCLAIFTNLRPEWNEVIARLLLAIFLNLRPERNALIARFWPIATNLST